MSFYINYIAAITGYYEKLVIISEKLYVKNFFTGNCGICNKVVTDEGCTAFGKFYHKECFKCCVCKKKIAGKFFERNGKPYCATDFAVSDSLCINTFLVFWRTRLSIGFSCDY